MMNKVGKEGYEKVVEKSSSSDFNEIMESGNPQLLPRPLSILKPYLTRQSFGKAVARTRKTLPMSPHNKLAVVASLASFVSLSLEGKKTRKIR